MATQIRYRKFSGIPFTKVSINDQFWSPRLKAHKKATLKACLEQCELTGRISNFDKAAGKTEGEFEGIFFNDSDVYKVLEGAAYSLMHDRDAELEAKVDRIIEKISAAQKEDGYLLCYYILQDQDQRWTDMSKHEMYCGGHLIEAAVAYKQATGKDQLLQVAIKLADHYDSLFGPEKRHWVPGHEEIELALVKLYRVTDEDRYWKLALWLLEERGHGHGKGEIWEKPEWGSAYCQDDKPIREMSDVNGHAVRAMYLYTAVADVVAMTGDQDAIDALDRLWESVVLRNMYLTGGIGPSRHNEGFTEDYDLPNDTAYCETCASIGMVYWNHRMNLLHGDSKYADIVERAMYNGALSGVSLSGDKFFYVNPLSSDGSHHRVPWFDVSCCPTQISRFIPSIGDYVYAANEKGIWTNLYIAGTSSIPFRNNQVRVTQETNYPWDGCIKFTVESVVDTEEFELNLRYPGWCKSAKVSINGTELEHCHIEQGYIVLKRTWNIGDTIILDLDMPVNRVYSHPKVQMNQGKVALQRGPLVYCLEQTDHDHPLEQITLSTDMKFTEFHNEGLLEGVTVISGINDKQKFAAIPYYAWDNRKPGAMTVWLKETRVESMYID